MKTERFQCLNCGHKFEEEVFEKGEAEAKKVRAYPIHCPKCNRTDVREGW